MQYGIIRSRAGVYLSDWAAQQGIFIDHQVFMLLIPSLPLILLMHQTTFAGAIMTLVRTC